eukprot:CAMPEP_0185181408 /NCGR_PEP_ID=MMETSP1139-20130426/32997_1 /TAXON_ID=298111 /ORGANISM="Pavlova sp., Strain CCMP459" /LENGTH=453 /DNA_ID=CAMNT_0027747243 /DNA_START=30 /DNA_END=1388 /DNA_ORIENTATION=-
MGGIGRANSRLRLAALYLGTEELEQALVAGVLQRIRSTRGLSVSVLLDRMRATRPDQFGRTSISTLSPLLAPAGDVQPIVTDGALGSASAGGEGVGGEGVGVHLFHPPAVADIVAQLPPRFNEILAVQHVKAFVFDNDVLITGANMSSDYFTNRHDRYVLISGEPQVADFFDDLLKVLGACSFTVPRGVGSGFGTERARTRLIPPRCVTAPGCCTAHPLEVSRAMTARIHDVFHKHRAQSTVEEGAEGPCDGVGATTFVVPTVQLGSADLRQDESVCTQAMALPSELGGGSVTVSSPYCNFTPAALQSLARRPLPSVKGEGSEQASTPARVELITAASEANGFYASRGVSSLLPTAYAILEYDALIFLEDRIGAADVTLRLWRRGTDTFHAKGIWYAPPARGQDDAFEDPCLTVVGSSNFGVRSTERDLEAQILLVTSDHTLRGALGRELKAL